MLLEFFLHIMDNRNIKHWKFLKTGGNSSFMKHPIRLIAACILFLAVGAYAALCASVDTGHILNKTTVNDIDVSGMTLDQASAVLKDDAALRHEDAEFAISFEDTHFTVSAGDALELDYDTTAKDALKASQGSFWMRGISQVKASFIGNHIDRPAVKVNSGALHRAITDSGLPLGEDSIQLPYSIKDSRLTFTPGAAIKKNDEKKLEKNIISSFQEKRFKEKIPCPVKTDGTATLDQIYQDVYKAPQNATLDPENNYAIVDEVIGIDFDKESGENALKAAKEGEEASIDLIYTNPEVTVWDLRDRLFVDVLSTYTTKVRGSSNRLTNVKLAAKKCNGSIIPSGYEFSFNKAVGEQTKATGYKPAGATLNGKPVQAYGGGICQVTSTIFAASLFANLDILERWEHDYVSSYIDAGLDAAVAWGELDFRIANSFSYPVMMDVIYSDGYLTVTIRGTKTDDSFVSVSTEELDSSTPHSLEVLTRRKVYTENKSLVTIEEVARSRYAR